MNPSAFNSPSYVVLTLDRAGSTIKSLIVIPKNGLFQMSIQSKILILKNVK